MIFYFVAIVAAGFFVSSATYNIGLRVAADMLEDQESEEE